jgi:hypothetical protein
MMIIKYIYFATISTALNLLSQYFSLVFYNDFGGLFVAILIGTVIGMTSKYFLDKNYIFYYVNKDRNRGVKNFFFYSLTGIFTTIIFWGFEIGFHFTFNSNLAKYIGAIIGLSIGYFLKFFLDRKYVFKAYE